MAHGIWSGESALLVSDGSEIPTSQVIIAQDAADRPQFISTIIRDLKQRHEVEQALRALDRRKDEFLAMLAHELRNPLAPIAAAAQIIRLKGVDATRLERASAIISRQVDYMTRLLDDLLDVSRVTRGLIRIESKPVDLAAVVEEAVEQSLPAMEARRHELRVRAPSMPVEGARRPHAHGADGGQPDEQRRPLHARRRRRHGRAARPGRMGGDQGA
jgi:signal transduction histidine kinase